jgi:replication-associated recombination protein RarA
MDRYRNGRLTRLGDLVGAANAVVVADLRRMALLRSAESLLLLGRPGSAKTWLGRWLQKSYCCARPDPVTADPCGACDGCDRQGPAFNQERHVGPHWEVDCTRKDGRKAVREILEEAEGEEAPRLFFDEFHWLGRRPQSLLLKFADDLRGGLLVLAAACAPPFPAPGHPQILPELFSRVRKVYLHTPTADEMVAFFAAKAREWKIAAPEPVVREMVVRSGRDFRECLDRLDAAAATPAGALTAEILNATLPPAAGGEITPATPLW